MSVNERENRPRGTCGQLGRSQYGTAGRDLWLSTLNPRLGTVDLRLELHYYFNSRMKHLKALLKTVVIKLTLVVKIVVIWWILFIVWCSCTVAR